MGGGAGGSGYLLTTRMWCMRAYARGVFSLSRMSGGTPKGGGGSRRSGPPPPLLGYPPDPPLDSEVQIWPRVAANVT